MAVPEFIPAATVTDRNRVIATPFQYYFTGAENLELSVWNVGSLGMSVTVQGRMFLPRGDVVWISETFEIDSSAQKQTFRMPIGDGFLSNLVVFMGAASNVYGQTFIRLQVILGIEPNRHVLGTLLQGFVYGDVALGWPGSPIVNSLEGPGYTRVIAGTIPGAGAEIFESVAFRRQWELLAITFTLTTTAVAGARRPRLRIVSGTLMNESPAVATTAAGGFTVYSWQPNMPGYAPPLVALRAQSVLPWPNRLPEGASIQTQTDAIDVGDQYGQPLYYVQEWLTCRD